MDAITKRQQGGWIKQDVPSYKISIRNRSDFYPDSFLQRLAASSFVHLNEVFLRDSQVNESFIMWQARELRIDTVNAWASTAGPRYYNSVTMPSMMLHECLPRTHLRGPGSVLWD